MRMRAAASTWIFLIPLVLGVTPASAGVDGWVFGAGFNLGNVRFRVGYAEGSPYGPSYYFEAGTPLAYPGRRCSSYCYRTGGRYYHHPSCGAVGHHFAAHGYAPVVVIERWGPPGFYRPHGPYRYEPYSCGPHCSDHRYQKHHKKHYKVPPGHLRAPGHQSRWFSGRPPGHQSRPPRCGAACYPGRCGSGCVPFPPYHGPPGYGH